MRRLLTAAMMRKADEFTVKHHQISSVELMEKASRTFVNCFERDEPDKTKIISVFCGKGNNGGDGLAIARLLYLDGYTRLKVFIAEFLISESPDYKINLERLTTLPLEVNYLQASEQITLPQNVIVIDALLGSGFQPPLRQHLHELVSQINAVKARVYAVDVPTGCASDGILSTPYDGLRAHKTITFQRPKISFLFPESAQATNHFEVVDVGLDEAFIQSNPSTYAMVDLATVQSLLWPRKPFTHKGTYGHVLLIAGSAQTMGAALLNAKGSLYAGAGLVTAAIPDSGLLALNTALPEVMFADRKQVTDNLDKYQAIGIGSGLGTGGEAYDLLSKSMMANKPLVIDADALNILSKHQGLQSLLRHGMVMTPHMKEFDRLFGIHASWYDRVQKARQIAQEYRCAIVLKNQYTFIVNEEGHVAINPTGHPAMAQAGMGDVLTGIITAYLGQGYSAYEAAVLGCYLHGKSGAELSDHVAVTTASQVAENLPKTVRHILGATAISQF